MRIVILVLFLTVTPAFSCDKHPSQTHEEWMQMNFSAGQKRIDTTPNNSFFDKKEAQPRAPTQNENRRRPIRRVR